LKLNYDEQLSNFALNFNLRLYIMGELCEMAGPFGSVLGTIREELAKVRRCRWTVSNPMLKAPMVSALETRIS